MDDSKGKPISIESLNDLLESFIRIVLEDKDIDFDTWVKSVSAAEDSFCHDKMGCKAYDCPGYNSECGRCWLIAGTLCDGKVQGKFADKIDSCTECKVFKEFIGNDPLKRQRELIFVLVHSLLLRTKELKNALAEVTTLSGMLPICANCKNIRDDKGYWSHIESYLSEHSGLQFTHSLCQDCIRKLYPDLADKILAPKPKKS